MRIWDSGFIAIIEVDTQMNEHHDDILLFVSKHVKEQ